VELDHLEVRAESEELGAAAEARGPDPGAFAQLLERGSLADVGIAGRLPRRDPGDLEPLRKLAREVLGRVHPEVDLAVEQRPLDLADEASLVPSRLMKARGLDRHDRGFRQPGLLDRLRDRLGLGERQSAASGAEPDRRTVHSRRPSGCRCAAAAPPGR
jgi:hypothetical protein